MSFEMLDELLEFPGARRNHAGQIFFVAIRVANHVTRCGVPAPEASVIPSHLIELGQQALAAVTTAAIDRHF
jgi:hypothetical protein